MECFKQLTIAMIIAATANMALSSESSTLTVQNNYIWINSDWTECSVICGRGIQTRNVNCTAEDGRIVDNSFCNIHYKPEESRPCRGPHCEGTWIAEDWLEECVAFRCHAAGKQYRNVFCIYNGVTSIDDHSIKCDPATMPPAVRDCYLTKGCPPEWKGLEWSQCSATCGGTQTREIVCILGNEILHDERCPAARPSIIQRCGPECPTLEICDNKDFCRLDNLALCPKECCDMCEKALPGLTPQQRYQVCEKNCCKRCSPFR